MRNGFLIGGLLLAVAIVALWQLGSWFTSNDQDEVEALPVPQPIVEVAEPGLPDPVEQPVLRDTLSDDEPSSDAAAELILPELNASDAFIKNELALFSLPVNWLDREDLLRRLAVVVDNAARGEYPRGQLGFLAPAEKFKVIENSQGVFLDSLNYRRFDSYLDILEGVDPGLLATLLEQMAPLVDEALAELGNQDDSQPQILSAIEQILDVPHVTGDIELIQPKVFYEYANPSLEALSPLQKQVLRLGPTNIARLKEYLEALRSELD